MLSHDPVIGLVVLGLLVSPVAAAQNAAPWSEAMVGAMYDAFKPPRASVPPTPRAPSL